MLIQIQILPLVGAAAGNAAASDATTSTVVTTKTAAEATGSVSD